MDVEPLRVLVIAPPSLWRDSLRVLLQGNHLVTSIDEAGDIASGRKLCQQNQPNLVLLDASLPELSNSDTASAFDVGAIGQRCLVLTHSYAQEQAARAAGFRATLPEGFSTTALYTALSTAAPIWPH